ncbi:hypothetical protein ACP4OV_002119 [Aristida adscensionis]
MGMDERRMAACDWRRWLASGSPIEGPLGVGYPVRFLGSVPPFEAGRADLRTRFRILPLDNADRSHKVVCIGAELLLRKIMGALDLAAPVVDVVSDCTGGLKAVVDFEAPVRTVTGRHLCFDNLMGDKMRSFVGAKNNACHKIIQRLKELYGVRIIDRSSIKKQELEGMCRELYMDLQMLSAEVGISVGAWQRAQNDLEMLGSVYIYRKMSIEEHKSETRGAAELTDSIVEKILEVVKKYKESIAGIKGHLKAFREECKVYVEESVSNEVRRIKDWASIADISGTHMLSLFLPVVGEGWSAEIVDCNEECSGFVAEAQIVLPGLCRLISGVPFRLALKPRDTRLRSLPWIS